MPGSCAADGDESLIAMSSVDGPVATIHAAGYNAATGMQPALCSVMHTQHAICQGS